MVISGSYTLRAPREQVWNALRDTATLKRAIPGCESLEQTDDNTYTVRLRVDAAGVKGVFCSALRVLEIETPESYRMIADSADARGVMHSDGVLRLEASDAGTTIIHYAGQAHLGGAIAGMSAQMAHGAAHLLIRRYFVQLANLLPSAPPAPPAPILEPAPTALSAAVVDDTPLVVASQAPLLMPPLMSPPTAPIIQRHRAPETLATPATLASPSAIPGPPTIPVPPRAQRSIPLMTAPPQSGLTDGAVESQQSAARFIFAVIAILAAAVVVAVVMVVVAPFR